jgi:hypothetical protein
MDTISAKQDVELVETSVKPTNQLPLPDELLHLDDASIQNLEKSLVKRLDWTLMPVVVLLFLLNILDRNNIANAKVAGLTTTLHISDAQYNTCLMIFYVGCIPSNPLMVSELSWLTASRCNYSSPIQPHHRQSSSVDLYL